MACDLRLQDVDARAEQMEMNLFESDSHLYDKVGSPDVCLHMAWRDGFQHNSFNHMGDLSSHYRFLTRLVDSGLKRLAVMGTMHEVGYWEGMIDEKYALQSYFDVWHCKGCSSPFYDNLL